MMLPTKSTPLTKRDPMENCRTTKEIRVPLEESTDNAQVVIAALELAVQAGFSETDRCMIATAASELATNILRYAEEGVLSLKLVRKEQKIGIEILAEDDGPGIENVPEAMRDHVSSGNSLGLGLPSVKRIMDEFSVDSVLGRGTLVWARKWR